jgi:hypothetical protein
VATQLLGSFSQLILASGTLLVLCQLLGRRLAHIDNCLSGQIVRLNRGLAAYGRLLGEAASAPGDDAGATESTDRPAGAGFGD